MALGAASAAPRAVGEKGIPMVNTQAVSSAVLRRGAGLPLRRLTRALVRATLGGTLAVSVLVFAVGALPILAGMKTMVVTSGSMEPAIHVGDAVCVKPVPAESVQVGDVVTFGDAAGKGMVTHRVIAIKEIQGVTYLQTQGDANRTPDPNLTPLEAVYGKVALRLPMTGYLLHYASTPWGKLLLMGLPLGLLIFQEATSLLKGGKSRRQKLLQETEDAIS